jgi:hypothetical protein
MSDMTDDREFLRATTKWLEAGSDVTPPKAVDAVLLAVRTTRQDRVLPVPWRPIDMNALSKALIAAAALVAVALAWINLGPLENSVGAVPTPIVSPTPSPTPTPKAVVSAGDTPLDPTMRYVTSGVFPIHVTFAAPAGWTGHVGGPYAAYVGPAGADSDGLVSMELFDKVYADPCHQEQGPLNPPVGRSGDALANALASLPGLHATTPTKTTFGGLPATALTITAPADVSGCTDGMFRVWELPLGATEDMRSGDSVHVWIIDVGSKRLVVSAPADQAGSPVPLAEVQTVLDSMQIEGSN